MMVAYRFEILTNFISQSRAGWPHNTAARTNYAACPAPNLPGHDSERFSHDGTLLCTRWQLQWKRARERALQRVPEPHAHVHCAFALHHLIMEECNFTLHRHHWPVRCKATFLGINAGAKTRQASVHTTVSALTSFGSYIRRTTTISRTVHADEIVSENSSLHSTDPR